ncbi:MAG: hypothetical protein RL538_818 [Candidatus Parcubacteria bacterium]|jgi:hypothetical protein
MSPQEQLADYIQKSRAIGKTDESIKQELLTAGWQLADVTAAFDENVTASTQTTPLPATNEYAGFWHRVAASIVDSFLLWLVAVAVIVPVILMTTIGTLPTSDLIFGFVYLLQFAIFILYYPYMESKKRSDIWKNVYWCLCCEG